MRIDRIFSGLNISAAGLTAQRKRMNAIASNLANAETTRTEQGGPYRRKIVTLKAKSAQIFSRALRQAGITLNTTNSAHLSTDTLGSDIASDAPFAIQTQETEDTSPPKMDYDPGNPDADENGYVKAPNINVVTEMVGMMSASHAFEANVTAITAQKNMAKDSLEI